MSYETVISRCCYCCYSCIIFVTLGHAWFKIFNTFGAILCSLCLNALSALYLRGLMTFYIFSLTTTWCSKLTVAYNYLLCSVELLVKENLKLICRANRFQDQTINFTDELRLLFSRCVRAEHTDRK